MPTRPKAWRKPGAPTPTEARRLADRERGSARARGYSAEWDAASKAFLAEHPLCQYCEAGVFAPARVSAAKVTDHLFPQRAFPALFWIRHWWVAACGPCHDGPKQKAETLGLPALDRLAALLGRPARPRGGG